MLSYVVKRNGKRQPVMFDKITTRIAGLSWQLSEQVKPALVAQRVIPSMTEGMHTSQLDDLSAATAAALIPEHVDYGKLAARIATSNLHKETEKSFSKLTQRLATWVDPKTKRAIPMVREQYVQFVMEHADELDGAIRTWCDYEYDYFGFKTLMNKYLLRLNDQVVERPQHLLMRVACEIGLGDIERVKQIYHDMSERYYTHATPTMFNAGAVRAQLASCTLLTMKDDSIEGIYDTLKQTAMLSKYASGLGVHLHKIRAQGTLIAGTGGKSNGLIPMLRVFNNSAKYVDQGGQKRKGVITTYLEPWHADIEDYLELHKNHGEAELRARDLYLGLWLPDLFMERVENNQMWSLFCPHEAPGLWDVWGEKFRNLYEGYEAQDEKARKEGQPPLARKQLPARELWQKILEAQVEGGQPYMCYKDHANAKSNQQHLGTLQGSNLCTEIMEFTSPDEIAVCNLASLSLPRFYNESTEEMEWDMLGKITSRVVRNLDTCIDHTFYAVEEAKRSNLKHRPLGLGAQGWANLLQIMHLDMESAAAAKLNRELWETIYYWACSTSCDLAQEKGAYESFAGSPMSQGKFQFDLWGQPPAPGRHDWDALRRRIMTHGMRNSLLLAPMPTATTSQILGNYEGLDPMASNLFVRRTLAGDFMVANPHLVKDLQKRKLWNKKMQRALVAHKGSVQKIPGFPEDLKPIYKTAWEISGQTILDLAADRGRFIDQSQSLNVSMAEPTFQKLTSMHFYGWKKGLKTGMYYLRTRPAADAIAFTVNADDLLLNPSIDEDVEQEQKKTVEENGKEDSSTHKKDLVVEKRPLEAWTDLPSPVPTRDIKRQRSWEPPSLEHENESDPLSPVAITEPLQPSPPQPEKEPEAPVCRRRWLQMVPVAGEEVICDSCGS